MMDRLHSEPWMMFELPGIDAGNRFGDLQLRAASRHYRVCWWTDVCPARLFPSQVHHHPMLKLSKNSARPNNLAPKLDKMGIHILGTAAQNIDRAEDRSKFSAMCDELGIDQPEWSEFVKMEDGLSTIFRQCQWVRKWATGYGICRVDVRLMCGTHGILGAEPQSCLLVLRS